MAYSGNLIGRWYRWPKRVLAVNRAMPQAEPEGEPRLEARVRREAAMRAADTSRRSNQVELWRIWPPLG